MLPGVRVGVVRVYVAAPSSRWRQAREIMENLAYEGYYTAWDWTSEVEHWLATGEFLAPPEQLVAADLGALEGADALVLAILPGDTTAGAWLELGYAMALGKPIVVLCPSPEPGWIFLSLVTVVASPAELLRHLAEIAEACP